MKSTNRVLSSVLALVLFTAMITVSMSSAKAASSDSNCKKGCSTWLNKTTLAKNGFALSNYYTTPNGAITICTRAVSPKPTTSTYTVKIYGTTWTGLFYLDSYFPFHTHKVHYNKNVDCQKTDFKIRKGDTVRIEIDNGNYDATFYAQVNRNAKGR